LIILYLRKIETILNKISLTEIIYGVNNSLNQQKTSHWSTT